MNLYKNMGLILLLTLSIGSVALAQKVTMIEAEQQITAQLLGYSQAVKDQVIAQMRKLVDKRTKLIDQQHVTDCIMQATGQTGTVDQDKNSEEAILKQVLEESKKTAAQENQARADKELARVLEESKKDAYAKIFEQHPVYGLVVKKIQALQKLPIVQLCAIDGSNQVKKGDKAAAHYKTATHCVRNAWAIASLLEKHLTINAKNIQTEASLHQDIIPAHATEQDNNIDTVMHKAAALKLSNAYHIECTDNKLVGYVIDQDPQLKTFSSLHVQQLLKELTEKNNWAISFICHHGSRYFLISLVKEAQKKPVLFYLDPLNEQLEHNSTIHKCVQEIHRICTDESAITKFVNNFKRSFVYPVLNTVKRIARWVVNLF